MAKLEMLVGRGTITSRQPFTTARRSGYLTFNTTGSDLISQFSIQAGHGPQPRTVWAGFTEAGDIFFAFVGPDEAKVPGYEANWNEQGILRLSLADLFRLKKWRVLKNTRWNIPLVLEDVPEWGALPVLKMKSVSVEPNEERDTASKKDDGPQPDVRVTAGTPADDAPAPAALAGGFGAALDAAATAREETAATAMPEEDGDEH